MAAPPVELPPLVELRLAAAEAPAGEATRARVVALAGLTGDTLPAARLLARLPADARTPAETALLHWSAARSAAWEGDDQALADLAPSLAGSLPASSRAALLVAEALERGGALRPTAQALRVAAASADPELQAEGRLRIAELYAEVDQAYSALSWVGMIEPERAAYPQARALAARMYASIGYESMSLAEGLLLEGPWAGRWFEPEADVAIARARRELCYAADAQRWAHAHDGVAEALRPLLIAPDLVRRTLGGEIAAVDPGLDAWVRGDPESAALLDVIPALSRLAPTLPLPLRQEAEADLSRYRAGAERALRRRLSLAALRAEAAVLAPEDPYGLQHLREVPWEYTPVAGGPVAWSNGEIWRDELGTYRYSGPSLCPKTR